MQATTTSAATVTKTKKAVPVANDPDVIEIDDEEEEIDDVEEDVS